MRLIPPQDCFHPRDKLFRVKRLYNIIICAQFQPQHFIKGFPLCRQHNDRYAACLTDFCTDLIAVHTRQHQVKQYQIRLKRRYHLYRLPAIMNLFCFKAFLFHIKRNQLRDMHIVIYNQNLLFSAHFSAFFQNSSSVVFCRSQALQPPRPLFLLHDFLQIILLHAGKGFLTDAVLHPTGVLQCGFLAHANVDQHL